METGRDGKLFNERHNCLARGSFDGKLIGRLPGVVVIDQGGLVEGAGGRRLDGKWMVDLLCVEMELEPSQLTRIYGMNWECSQSQLSDFHIIIIQHLIIRDSCPEIQHAYI